jgi:hypothetical protein
MLVLFQVQDVVLAQKEHPGDASGWLDRARSGFDGAIRLAAAIIEALARPACSHQMPIIA